MSLTLHKALHSFDRVDLYLAASEFVRAKHIEAGLPSERIITKPNFAWNAQRREGPGRYFLYAGRLSREKDVATVLVAWRGLDAPLMIVGDGPDGEKLRRSAPQGVEFRGALAPDEIPAILTETRALIIPSLSYEGAPRTVVEAYASGVPVLATAVGALPELVEDGVSGLLVPPHNPAAIAGAVERMSDDAESVRLGDGAWAAWREHYTPEQGLVALEDAYRDALGDRRPE